MPPPPAEPPAETDATEPSSIAATSADGSQDAELEAAIAAIRASKDLPRPPYPTLPNLNSPGPIQAKVTSVQTYIEKLSYNQGGLIIPNRHKLAAVIKTNTLWSSSGTQTPTGPSALVDDQNISTGCDQRTSSYKT